MENEQGYKGEERRRCPVAGCQEPEKAAKYAVKHVFEILGVNVDDPKEVEDFRKGLRYGEELLSLSKKGKIAIMVCLLGLTTTAIYQYIVSSIKSFFHH